MSHPYITGASQVLLHSSPILAHAANIAKEFFKDRVIFESLEHFEHDLALIHLQIKRLSQYSSGPEAADLENHILRVYDFKALDKVLDRIALAQALEGVPMEENNTQSHIRINGFPAIEALYRLAIYRPNLNEPLSYVNLLDKQVCFIVQSDSVATTLEALLNANGRLQLLLNSLVAARSGRGRLYNENFSPQRAATRDTVVNQETLPRDMDLQFDFERSRESLRALHKALHSTWPVHTCVNDHQTGNLWQECHSARLRITGTWRNEPKDSGQYDLLLCTKRQVLYECEVEVYKTRISAIPDEWLLICRAEQNLSEDYKLKLFTNEDQLHLHKKMSSVSECDWVDYDELPLSEFVPYNELKHKEKLILSVVLARSLLHLLGTDWLSSDWGMEDISIYYKKPETPAKNNEPRELNIRQAYISTQFTKAKGVVDGHALDAVHRQPRILRLGIVIMQLMLGDRLKDDEDLREGRMGNREIKRATKLYKACELRFSKTWKVLKALRNCTDVNLFSKLDSDESSIEVCKTYYSNIVKLLEEALFQDEDITLSQVEDEIRTSGAESHRGFNALIKPPLEQKASKSLKRDYSDFTEGNTSSPSKKRAAQNESYALAQFEPHSTSIGSANNKLWNEELGQLKQFFKNGRTVPMEEDSFNNLIKVAIIDTGCDLDHEKINPHLEGWRRKRNGQRKFEYQVPGIWGWEDFVDKDPNSSHSSMKDTSKDGHGTFMTYLLLETMPLLKVFIARVFDGSESSGTETYTRVTDAINHAVNDWEVDIISMSFHLSGGPKDVKDAISDASKRGVLFFAAAGNNLHYQRDSIAFPATLPSVFCINSHNNNNTKNSDFTPLARNYSLNFMVIGQGLEGPGENGMTKCMSGTSCATPIAAAFAAMVLDYIREHLEHCPCEDREKLDLLKDDNATNAMKWIFFDCMVEIGTEKFGDYNVVKPGLLFREDWRHGKRFSRIIAAIERGIKLQPH